MIKKLTKKLVEYFFLEQDQWFLWVPVLFSIGISVYFKLYYEPSLYIVFFTIFLFIVSYPLIKSAIFAKKLFHVLLIVYSGFLVITIKANIINAPIIPYEDKFYKIKAEIKEIQPLVSGNRLIFHHITFLESKSKNIPKKIRVTFKTNISDANVGDIVEFSAILSKPHMPIMPDNYNFARFAFFDQIGAVGYAVSNIKILEKTVIKFTNKRFIDAIRNDISKKTISLLGPESGSIVTALLIGEYSSINKELLNNMRISGLAHIMAVSGLHITLITSIFFFGSRFFLNLFSYLALEWNTKKISAFIALVGSFVYLLITGAHIAAIRAFIMTSIFLLAIIFDRIQVGLRSVAIAALIILFMYPEYIVHPSFQMSFAAVISLISVYDLLVKKGFKLQNYNIFHRLLFYFVSLIITSLIAGIATSPFAAYHFHQFSKYSILANIIVIPIISIFIMPLVVISLLLYPFGLIKYPLLLLNYGIKYIIIVANFVSNLPYSYNIIPFMPDYCLILIVLGGLWFLLWQKNWRYLGIIPIIISVLMISKQNLPDMIIDKSPGSYIFRDNKGQVIFSKTMRSEFKKNIWTRHFGQEEGYVLDKYIDDNLDYQCNEDKCIFTKNHKNILINFNKLDLFDDCYRNDVVFLPNSDKIINLCKDSYVITKDDLKKQGSHLIFLAGKLKIETVVGKNGYRLWSQKK